MSRAITVASIMVLILAMSFGGIWYSHEVREEFRSLIAEAHSLAADGDSEGLGRHTEQMRARWEEREAILSFYVRHDLLEQMTQYLINLKGYAATETLASAQVTLEQMQFLAEHIYERELPNWNNVL